MSEALDPDMYEFDGEEPKKVTKEEFIERKREKLREQIKYHKLMVWVLEQQLETTTTIELVK